MALQTDHFNSWMMHSTITPRHDSISGSSNYSSSSASSSPASSSFEFDLNLLDCEVPSLELSVPLPSLSLDCQVPSPSTNYDLPDVLSPTMFSPTDISTKKTSSATPRTTPYSPPSSMTSSVASAAIGAHGRGRLSSTESSTSTASVNHPIPSSVNEAFAEFQQLQSTFNSPINSPMSYPPQTPSAPPTVPSSSAAPAVGPSSASASDINLQVKIEPLDHPHPHHHLGYPQQPSYNTPLLQQCLSDNSFKYNKSCSTPFDFGVSVGGNNPIGGGVGGYSMSGSGSVSAPATMERSSPLPGTSAAAASSHDVKMEPVISMAMEQVNKDIETTCEILGISADPRHWSREDVSRWMLWTMQQYGINSSSSSSGGGVAGVPFPCNGRDLVRLTEQDFINRFPQGGDLLYAQMDIWRSSAGYESSILPPPAPFSDNQPTGAAGGESSEATNNPPVASGSSIKEEPMLDISYVLQMLESTTADTTPTTPVMSEAVSPASCSVASPVMSTSSMASPPPPYSMALKHQQQQQQQQMSSAIPSTSGLSMFHQQQQQRGTHENCPIPTDDDETTDDDESMPKSSPVGASCSTSSSSSSTASTLPTGLSRNPSSNIHLWQFVKELLLQPQLYSGCIHWLDRQKGIFKIVDSVKVATLWGKRKNRPAMNYDKLSRSLRQYYKKGIMKKTERSQRLVYQFCHPYHM